MTKAKKDKLRKRKQIKLNEKKVSLDEETALSIYHKSGVDSKNPIVLDFYGALKKQKVFGAFCSLFKLKNLSKEQKIDALKTHQPITFGNITVRPFYNSVFIKKIQILRRMIEYNTYDHTKSISRITIEKVLGYYAKEYFKNKKLPIKHSLLYYQFAFGTASVIVGLFMMFGLIYYFWGGLVLGIILIATFIYSCIGIYKLCNVNLF